MMKKLLLFICLVACGCIARAGNVKIDSVRLLVDSLGYEDVITIKVAFSWENSWRDNHNWDAVYLFLKYKRATDVDWSHVLLRDGFHGVNAGFTYYPARYPSTSRVKDKAVGLFVYRDRQGYGKSSVSMRLSWKFGNNKLTRDDFLNGITIEAQAIEMVYIPKGPFRPGDQYSMNSFRKNYRQIRKEWDLITPETNIYQGTWLYSNPANIVPTDDDRTPDKVCNHDNYPHTQGYCGSLWISEKPGNASIIFQFPQMKKVRYVAMELFNYAVSSWKLSGGKKMPDGQFNWASLGTFLGEQAPVNSSQSYPATRAVEVPLPPGKVDRDAYEYYKVDLIMAYSGHYAHVRTISMTDRNLEELTDDAYIIDGPANTISYDHTLGLDNVYIERRSFDANYACGYEGFYAMKYEISQHQYVDFLNKLSVEEQKLRTIGDALDDLEMGDYVYGSGDHKTPQYRNGIVVGALQDNRYAFACNLTPGGSNAKGYNEENDGLNIACNFLSPRDMIAYAAWCGLRPLSELEYEKMGHQTIDSVSGKVPVVPIGSYAWGDATAKTPTGNSFSDIGKPSEKLSSANVNTGGAAAGPARVGSFSYGSSGTAKSSGASFYGVMELSGNLAEIYYRSEPGRVHLDQRLVAHGTGELTNGEMPDALNSYWGNPKVTDGSFGTSLILRGGSFASLSARARLSDRGEANGYVNDLNRKDSTVTFRLGHSVTACETSGDDYYPFSWIKSENNEESYEGMNVIDTVCTGSDYTIVGSDPIAEGVKMSGELRYVWYYKMDGTTNWTMLEGKNQKDLHLTAADLDHYSTSYRNYYYMRRLYTPTQWAESGAVQLRVGTNSPFTRDGEEVIRKSNQINGVLVESAPAADFEWYAKFGGQIKKLAAFYNSANSSYLSVVRDSFPGASSAELVCQVTTRELKCKKEVSVDLTIEPRPTSGIPSSGFNVRMCGRDVKDPRDNELYTTVQIGDQCWMAENLRHVEEDMVKNDWIRYSPADPQGKVYGVEYYTHWNVVPYICPPGWTLPSVADFNALCAVADENEDGYGSYRLKAGNYWVESREDWRHYRDYIYAKDVNSGGKKFHVALKKGFNTYGFGLMGGGYNARNPAQYHEGAFLMARNGNTWQTGWYLPYNGNFHHWSTSSYYLPVRCILESTSVD